MSLVTHVAVLGVVVLDLIFGASLVQHFAGSWAAVGFEFIIILGYVLLVLQLTPWRKDS
jgi:hypothetical protein